MAKFLAAIMVIVGHIINSYQPSAVKTILHSMVYSAVPMFIMISGYLFLNSTKKVNYKRICICIVFPTLIFALYKNNGIIKNNHWFSAYFFSFVYFTIYFELALLTPFLKKIIKINYIRTINYTLLIVFSFIFIHGKHYGNYYPGLNDYQDFGYLIFIPYLPLFIAGKDIVQIASRQNNFFLIVKFLGSIAIQAYLRIQSDYLAYIGYVGIFHVVNSTVILAFLSKINYSQIKNAFSRVIISCSNASYWIFIFGVSTSFFYPAYNSKVLSAYNICLSVLNIFAVVLIGTMLHLLYEKLTYKL